MKGQSNKSRLWIYSLVIAQDKSSAQLVSTYIQVSFVQQPSWLKENNFKTTLLENTNLFSELNLIFKN